MTASAPARPGRRPGTAQGAQQVGDLPGSRGRPPAPSRAAAGPAPPRVVDRDAADVTGPSGSPRTSSAGWRRGRRAPGRGWRAAWSCGGHGGGHSRRGEDSPSLLGQVVCGSAVGRATASRSARWARPPKSRYVGRCVSLVGVEKVGQEVGVSDGQLEEEESSRSTGCRGRSTIRSHPCSWAIPSLGVTVATSSLPVVDMHVDGRGPPEYRAGVAPQIGHRPVLAPQGHGAA